MKVEIQDVKIKGGRGQTRVIYTGDDSKLNAADEEEEDGGRRHDQDDKEEGNKRKHKRLRMSGVGEKVSSGPSPSKDKPRTFADLRKIIVV